jgi:hypothetical protein
VTVGIGIFFLMPGITWFITQRWWDRTERPATVPVRPDVVHQSVE